MFLQSLANDTIVQLLRCFMLRGLCILMPATKICYSNRRAYSSRSESATSNWTSLFPFPRKQAGKWQLWPAFVRAGKGRTLLECVLDSPLDLRPEGCHANGARTVWRTARPSRTSKLRPTLTPTTGRVRKREQLWQVDALQFSHLSTQLLIHTLTTAHC